MDNPSSDQISEPRFDVTPIPKPIIVPNSEEKKRGFKFGIKHVIAGAVLIVAVGVLFFFLGRSSFSESKVNVGIDGPSEVKGGEFVTYKVSYENNNRVDLIDAKLTFTYPADSIVIVDEEIIDLNNKVIDIGKIGAGEQGEREFTAYIVGDRGNIKQVKAVLSFQPGNLVTTIAKEASTTTTITSLPISLTLVAPPTAVNGQDVSYILDYRNETEEDFEDVLIEIELPDTFRVFTTKPIYNKGENVWLIPRLRAGEGSRISISGILIGDERDSKTISATVRRKVSTPEGETYIDFERVTASTAIASPFLSISATVNGVEEYVARLRETLRYEIKFKNNTTRDLLGVGLSAKLDGEMFDLTSVESDGFFDSRLNTVYWNASVVPQLGVLRANQTGSVKFTVRLKEEFPGGVIGSQNSLVKITPRIETTNVPPDLGVDRLIAEDELLTRIATNLSFRQELYVDDFEWGSSGPWPPKVDEKTTLTIRWSVANPVNLIAPAEITGQLLPGVEWVGNTRSNVTGTLPQYDSNSNSIFWDIGSVPGGVGTSFPPYEAYFQISIVPSINQINSPADLLKETIFTGRDTITSQEITRREALINTVRAVDKAGGTVQEN
ncbi:MAG: hypothetical protein COV29_02660 [Candidatus Yanofskybacteria bacterium CG10_big_fil_rev_8_21_14_0_10_36_16]|uniref:DUF11 domain-containing protein n=1 Tax=Candidatus Yanofskybacteria bacterium CG10_big_fil_rev_8_21_14_0_10_36_16 TaxID=1975096 RepID=A0A2J0Q7T9_9BACT|nr:MAG: hypothetical protein COV29_02660 [Candidatus Yanofskybacteria bacterium CG10_big_fil_rev_8_21_14_0_10_36_16]